MEGKNYTDITTWKKWTLFIVTGVLLVFSMPRNSAFHYDFQRGKEWMGEDIVASFDFPIYKTSDELSAERNKILTTHKPYFQHDISVEQQQLSAFSAHLENQFGGQAKYFKNILLKLLGDVYQRCILNKNEIPQVFADRQQLVISILKNNISEDRPISEIFTVDDAYNYIVSEFNKGIALNIGILPRTDIRNYIRTNITYDENTTNKIKKQLLEYISPTKGIVPAGTTIIAKGETINSKNIQILESFKKEYKKTEGSIGNFWLLLIGQILFTAICLFQLYFSLRWYQPAIFMRTKNIIFILFLILAAVFGCMQIIKSEMNIYLVPLTVVPVFISTFFRSRIGIFVYLTIILLVFAYVPNSFEFVFVSFIAGIASISEFRTWYRRGRLFISIGLIFLFYSVSYITACLIKSGSLETINLTTVLYFLANAVFVLFAYQLIYVFEKIFGFLSNSTLIELSDTNRALLRELSEKAPGTFQHSMQVANLAEDVVRQIDGDTLLVRVGALYHDIGKISNPEYFVENQQSLGSSLHENMKPEESAKIIISHVEDGIALARKYNLPADVIDFIRTHHATSKARYFLSKYKEQNPKATDFSAFCYPGPNPFKKELAVLMMADSIEAASRAQQNITAETINSLVEQIVNGQVAEGYMNDADLTFKELSLIKEIFKTKLKNIYHARIEYPKDSPDVKQN